MSNQILRQLHDCEDIKKDQTFSNDNAALMFIRELEDRILEGGEISEEEALFLVNLQGNDIYDLISSANRIKTHFKGNKVNLCSIVNAKSGLCPEDCSFCAQSAHFETKAPVYEMIDADNIVKAAARAKEMKSGEFNIVTSGSTVEGDEEIEKLSEALNKIKKSGGLQSCASLGNLSEQSLLKLKEAGLQSYHHNLETARSFFSEVCSTHDYDDDVSTVRRAKKIGLETCCGGIFGLGESNAQRVELAFTLKELDVDSIPMNFLNPIEGTAMENKSTVRPLDGLKTIALFRFVLPQKDILVSGGREVTFRTLQPLIFLAGANGTLIGNYLTTAGDPPEKILTMIEDLGLEVAKY